MRTTINLIAIAALAAAAACTQERSEPASAAPASSSAPASAPAPAALATTRQVMLGITTPTSDVVFGVGEQAPASDADWEKVQASAMSLAESANLLKVEGRRVDQPEWAKYVDMLLSSAQAAAQAAQEKNVDKVLEVGNQIY